MRAMIDDRFLEQVNGGDVEYILKDGTVVTDEIVDMYAEIFRARGLGPDALYILGYEGLGFALVEKGALNSAWDKGADMYAYWAEIQKRKMHRENSDGLNGFSSGV